MHNKAKIDLAMFKMKNYSENLVTNSYFTKFNFNDLFYNSVSNLYSDIFLSFRSFSTYSVFESFITYLESNPLHSTAVL